MSDDLYDNTEQVLDAICMTLGLEKYNFSEIAKFGVNINGNPGAGRALIKARGDYPPLLNASRLLSEPFTRQLCEEHEGMLRIPLWKTWQNQTNWRGFVLLVNRRSPSVAFVNQPQLDCSTSPNFQI